MNRLKNYTNKSKLFFIFIFLSIKNYLTKTFKNPKDTFFFLSIILFIAFAIPIIISFSIGGFFNFGTDDRIQYYPFMNNFINHMKNGTLSVFDTSVGAGTSIAASLYYVPLDLFTFLAFLLSYIIDTEKAVSITNYLYPIVGAMILYWTLIKDKRK